MSGYILMPLTIVTSILMRRWLDPYVYGLIATLNLLVYYSAFSNLGTLSAAEVKIPFLKGEGDSSRVEQISSSTFTFTLITGAVFSIGLAVWATMNRASIDRMLFMGLMVYALYLFGLQLANYYITLLRASQEFIFLSKYQFITGFLASIGNLLAVWMFGFKGFLAVSIIIVMFQLYLLVRHLDYFPTLKISWDETGTLLKTGLPMLILGLAAQGMKTVDNLLVLKLLSIEHLGYYTIALMANSMVFSVTNSLTNVLYPSMQEAYGKSGRSDSLQAYVIRPSIIMGVVIPVMTGILYFAVPVAVYWLIPKFAPGLPAFKIIVLSSYFFAMINMTTGYLISLNKQKSIIVIYLSMLLLVTGLSFLSTYHGYGLEGISLATAIGYFVCFLIVTVYVLRHWSGWMETFVFLKDTSLPFFYSTLLILILERYLKPGVDSKAVNAVWQISGFLLLYLPFVYSYERKTLLFGDFVSPILQRIKGGR